MKPAKDLTDYELLEEFERLAVYLGEQKALNELRATVNLQRAAELKNEIYRRMHA